MHLAPEQQYPFGIDKHTASADTQNYTFVHHFHKPPVKNNAHEYRVLRGKMLYGSH